MAGHKKGRGPPERRGQVVPLPVMGRRPQGTFRVGELVRRTTEAALANHPPRKRRPRRRPPNDPDS